MLGCAPSRIVRNTAGLGSLVGAGGHVRSLGPGLGRAHAGRDWCEKSRLDYPSCRVRFGAAGSAKTPCDSTSIRNPHWQSQWRADERRIESERTNSAHPNSANRRLPPRLDRSPLRRTRILVVAPPRGDCWRCVGRFRLGRGRRGGVAGCVRLARSAVGTVAAGAGRSVRACWPWPRRGLAAACWRRVREVAQVWPATRPGRPHRRPDSPRLRPGRCRQVMRSRSCRGRSALARATPAARRRIDRPCREDCQRREVARRGRFVCRIPASLASAGVRRACGARVVRHAAAGRDRNGGGSADPFGDHPPIRVCAVRRSSREIRRSRCTRNGLDIVGRRPRVRRSSASSW